MIVASVVCLGLTLVPLPHRVFIVTDSIFQIQNLSFAYHRQVIYDQANLTSPCDPGFTDLIGPNGSGKSTLFNLITQLLHGRPRAEFC